MSDIENEKKGLPDQVESVESLSGHQLHVGDKDIKIDEGDEILRLGLAQDDDVPLTPEREKKLVFKIDCYMLPLMCLTYCFQYMDKVTNSFASVLGLRQDLGMVGQEYAWTGSSFYLGYLVFSLPVAYFLQRLPVAKSVGTLIVIWGGILCLHSTPNNPEGFLALRTLLGIFESSITPAFTFITSQWYTADQTFLRITIWFACNGLGFVIGSLTAYGISLHAETYSIAPWKVLFIVTGLLTIMLGAAILLHLPDSPASAWFLSSEEKRLVVQRVRRNHQGFGNKHFKKDQVIEALTDYKTWLLFSFTLIGNVSNGGLGSFGSIIMNEQLHYDVHETLLMQSIGGAIEVVGCILISSMMRFYPSRFLWALVAQVIAATSQLMLTLASDKHARFAGLVLNNVGPVSFICILSLVASNVLGTTKKYITNAIILMGYCVGNLSGNAVFKQTEAPEYGTAKRAITVCAIIQISLLVVLFGVYYNENRIRDKKPAPEKIENIEFLDLTDKQNPFFRYSL